MTLFDHLNNLTYNKRKWKKLTEEEQKSANIFMLNRFISMKYEYIEMINELQTLNLPQSVLYDMYIALIPKQKTFFKYIKKSVKESKGDEIKLLTEVFEVSQKEAESYINLLDKEQLAELKKQVSGKQDDKKRIRRVQTKTNR